MIPKIIHYCWIGDADFPNVFQQNIEEWKILLPDYDFRFWGNDTLKLFKSVKYVQQAYCARKYAFVSDYIRAYVLFQYGGVYMDCDIKILKSFDYLLKFDFFAGIDFHPYLMNQFGRYLVDKNGLPIIKSFQIDGMGIWNAIIGSTPQNSLIEDLLYYYKNANFSTVDIQLGRNIGPSILAKIAEKYGFRYVLSDQHIDENRVIFSNDVFPCSKISSSRTLIMHVGADESTWAFKGSLSFKIYRKISRFLKVVISQIYHCIKLIIKFLK